MTDKDNELLQFLSEENEGEAAETHNRKWKIIVADDDEEVHAVTELALTGFQFKGRGLNILGAYSAAQSQQMILDNPDTAVILLDVVMESHDSGLQLVKFIRETAQNSMVRIILRTGQPGYAPEMEVITDYDINDYKEKTELTSSKLVTTLISSIRNYDDLKKIEEHRRSLEIISADTATMHDLTRDTPFDSFTTGSLAKLISSFDDETGVSLLNGHVDSITLTLQYCSGTGDFSRIAPDADLSPFVPGELQTLLLEEKAEEKIHYGDNYCLVILDTTSRARRFIYIKDLPLLSDIKKNILATFFSNLATINENIELMAEQKRKEDEIRKSLDEKMILVKEIHHRVKNNLQIISSLLHMQTSGLEDQKLLEVLRESENRVQSMSLVHEKLYQSDLMATIDFPGYLSSLAERLITTYSVGNSIKLVMNTSPLLLSINTAIPCGLIVNEILTNSIKYAFPDKREGEISISMAVSNGYVVLTVSDNGVGLPAEFDLSRAKSLGLKLIRVLTDQIDGTLKIKTDSGMAYELTFPESTERES